MLPSFGTGALAFLEGMGRGMEGMERRAVSFVSGTGPPGVPSAVRTEVVSSGRY